MENIEPSDLPIEILQPDYPTIRTMMPARSNHTPGKRYKLSKEILLNHLDESGWNKAEVGRRIGLSRTAIWKYMKKWDIPLQRADD